MSLLLSNFYLSIWYQSLQIYDLGISLKIFILHLHQFILHFHYQDLLLPYRVFFFYETFFSLHETLSIQGSLKLYNSPVIFSFSFTKFLFSLQLFSFYMTWGPQINYSRISFFFLFMKLFSFHETSSHDIRVLNLLLTHCVISFFYEASFVWNFLSAWEFQICYSLTVSCSFTKLFFLHDFRVLKFITFLLCVFFWSFFVLFLRSFF